MFLTFFFAKPVKPVEAAVEKEGEEIKPIAKEALMSFTPLQLQALQMLFTMPPEQRQKALAICMTPPQNLRTSVNSPQPATSVNSPQPAGSTWSCSSGDGDTRSVSSDGDTRIHHKNNISELAKYLSKTWFSAQKVWRRIYNVHNRICNRKLNKILAQIKPHLTTKEQKLLKSEKEKIVKSLKKKIAAARRYRLQAKTEARKRALEAPLAYKIDLSLSSDEEVNESQRQHEADGVSKEDQRQHEADGVSKEDRKDPSGGGDQKKEEVKDADGAGSGANDNNSPAMIYVCRKKLLLDEAKKFKAELKKNRDTRQRTRRSQATTTSKNKKVNSKKKNSGRTTRSASKRKAVTKSGSSQPDVTTPAKKKPTPDTEVQDSNCISPSRWRDRRISSKRGSSFDVGAKVMGCWKGPSCKGDWYEGVVHSIDDNAQTAHVVYKDGDFDKTLKWSDMRLL